MKRILFLLLLLLTVVPPALAQRMLHGRVTDSRTGEALPFVNVVYTAGGGTRSDLNGRFTLPFKQGRLRLSMVGYETKSFNVRTADDTLHITLKSLESSLGTAVVTGRKTKYSRKNNPAVELMRKVIAAK